MTRYEKLIDELEGLEAECLLDMMELNGDAKEKAINDYYNIADSYEKALFMLGIIFSKEEREEISYKIHRLRHVTIEGV